VLKTERQRKKGICTYCGDNDFISRDHIPPESMFPKPRPSNLITVPSCDMCNGGASMDDEYFRLNLSIRKSATLPAACPVANTALRGLGREEHSNFRTSFFKGLHEVDVVTKSGIYIERGGAYDVDLMRLSKVVSRTVRGLYFHHYNQRLPNWCEVDTWCLDGLREIDTATAETLKALINRLQSQPAAEIGDGVFKYWHCRSDDGGEIDNFSTLWLLDFYESTAFLGITIGRNPGNPSVTI
jgi:hypothetical protein